MAGVDLVKVIKENPGCIAIVDNDCWSLYKSDPDEAPTNDIEWARWEENNTLATDADALPLGDGGYGSGNRYGGDILQALAIIVGMKIRSV